MDFDFTTAAGAATNGSAGSNPSQPAFTFGVPSPKQPSSTFHTSHIQQQPQVPGTNVAPTPPNIGSLASSATQLSFDASSQQQQQRQQHYPLDENVESRHINPGSRVSLKQERGVGDSRRWRSRLWNQIENRIKDTRASLQNARRQGLLPDSSHSTCTIPAGFSGGGGASVAVGTGRTVIGGDAPPQLSEEEEQRIIAEEWEKFKAEHAAALLADLDGLSEREIEEFEQEMLQQRSDYDPRYDMLLEREQDEMQYVIEEYLRHSDMLADTVNAAATSLGVVNEANSLQDQVVALLVKQACFRCQNSPFQPLPAMDQQKLPHAAITAGGNPQEVACAACGYRLNGDALHYIANVAQPHSQSCAGRIVFDYDDDTGLLITCSACDLFA